MIKNILIISYYYSPVNNIGVQRIKCFKKYLEQYGYSISIITTNSFGESDDDNLNNIYRFPDTGYDYTHSESNSKITRLLFRVFRKLLVKIGIIIDGKYYWKKEVLKGINSIMKSKYFDIVLPSYPPPVNLEIGEFIYNKYGIPLIVDYRDGLMYDPFPEMMSNFIIFRIRVSLLEKRISTIASLILTVNHDMHNYYQKSYPNTKSVIIANGYEYGDNINHLPIVLPDGTNILYTGRLGKSRKVYPFDYLSLFLEKMFEHFPNINFIFIGDYDKNEQRLFASYENVYIYPTIDHNTIIVTQKIADALLLISGPRSTTSGKLYEYLFAHKPILNIGGEGEVSKIIDGYNFGITCAPDDFQQVNLFLNKLTTGELKIKYPNSELYTRRYQCKLLADELKDLCKKFYN